MTLHAHNQFRLQIWIHGGDLLENHQMSMEIVNPRSIPRLGEFVSVANRLYRVENVVHDLENHLILIYATGSQ